jgi:hypothetical protein
MPFNPDGVYIYSADDPPEMLQEVARRLRDAMPSAELERLRDFSFESQKSPEFWPNAHPRAKNVRC